MLIIKKGMVVMQKKRGYFILMMIVAGILAGCAKGTDTGDTIVKTRTGDEMLELQAGEISQQISPFFYVTKGDEKLLSLVYLKTADVKEDGAVQPKAAWIHKRRFKKKTVYRITLKEGWKDSQGNVLTAEDLMYNYLLRCKEGALVPEGFGQIKIEGLKEFQYGTTGKKCAKMEKKVQKALAAPDKRLRKCLEEKLILPALRKEYYWVEELYREKQPIKLIEKYAKPTEFFAKYYAADVTYNERKKSKETVISEIAAQYRGDYKKLEKITKEDYRALARNIAIQVLFPNRKSWMTEVKGIQKKGRMTVEITTEGYDSKDIRRLANVYLLSVHSQKEISEGRFFLTGTGGYTGVREQEKWILQANPYYSHQKPYVARLCIKE